ncbi:Aldehyde/histidinol dehydrogenase [Aspergillus tamarii]|uniref:Aldehyde/histidinol dehydrogenase n=1 Tax=Aspergillus tamarii TaxID=41984 RepID=A0A5N6UL34_ASPTM|nr:Aldehyde/histidinol dehydrogenase [Aspergillus tamarii]
MSTERIIVSRKIIEPFREAFLQEVSRWDSGSGRFCTLIQEAAVKRNQRLAKDAVSKGAQLLSGNPDAREKPPQSGEESQLRLLPTVLEGVDKSMDAISLANDTEYGLSCSLFTTDLAKGLRLARRVDTGAVHINSMSIHDEAALAHGGQNKSGWGSFQQRMGDK